MKFESAFDLGETYWCIVNGSKVMALTIGLVRIEEIRSAGVKDSFFDNYKPKISYKEEYMCIETGIGTGSMYTLGRNIFKTHREALEALDKQIKKTNKGD